jgi:two-component system sensor histidine kinase AlgZ
MLAFSVASPKRVPALLARRRRALVPIETLIAFVVISPLFAVLLSRGAVHGTWQERLSIVVGVVSYTGVIALCMNGVFNGLLARSRWLTDGPSGRFAVYWLVAAVVVTLVSHAWAPVFVWMGLPPDPMRRAIQTLVVVSLYLAGAFLFKHSVQRIAHEQQRALEERTAALDARIQALQARTNPHFLFNTLNSIMTLIAKDPERAEQLVGRLATLMRYSIEGADRSHVALAQELDAVGDYLEIERARFGARLRVTMEIEDAVDRSARVPPMILQPLVENAILHGVARSVEGGAVRIGVSALDGEVVELVVDDDGAPADASPHVGTNTSLANLRERLRMLYGEDASLTVGSRAGGGFRARVTVPSIGSRSAT